MTRKQKVFDPNMIKCPSVPLMPHPLSVLGPTRYWEGSLLYHFCNMYIGVGVYNTSLLTCPKIHVIIRMQQRAIEVLQRIMVLSSMPHEPFSTESKFQCKGLHCMILDGLLYVLIHSIYFQYVSAGWDKTLRFWKGYHPRHMKRITFNTTNPTH